MKTLSQIQNELAAGQFEFSRHAFRRVVERNISEADMNLTQPNGSKTGNEGSHV